MYVPSLRLAAFEGLPEAARLDVLVRVLEALTACNVHFLHGNTVPRLYQSGVRYLEHMPCTEGEECWQDVRLCLASGIGNCKELSSWRIAELALGGEHATHDITRTRVQRLEGGGQLVTYHVRVRRADGTIEDPSRRLGMK